MEELRGSLAPKHEKEDFHLEQLGQETIDHLLDMDLANKPEAQNLLLQFLREMGVSDESLVNSRIGQTALSQKASRDIVEKFDMRDIVDSMGL